jgi:glucokinase
MFLGIEIGGTKLQLGVGPGDGTLAGRWRGPVDPATGADGIREQITRAVPELLARAGVDRSRVAGVGVGFGGPVDDATQTVIKSHQIAGWDDFPLAEWVAELVGWPAVLGNDADVAGLAEALFGAGKGLSPVFYVTIGSGIGGGLVVAGEIYRGVGRGAAEIGHLRVGRYGELLELKASGWAIQRQAQAMIDHQGAVGSVLPEVERAERRRVTAEDVARAAEQGDALAQSLLTGAWTALADGLCHVIALLCPRRIVIGGGVSLMGEALLFEPLRRLVAERVFAPFAGCYDIVPAALGEEVVVHGALGLARRRFAARDPRSGGNDSPFSEPAVSPV